MELIARRFDGSEPATISLEGGEGGIAARLIVHRSHRFQARDKVQDDPGFSFWERLYLVVNVVGDTHWRVEALGGHYYITPS
jgi:hypothetical protein